MVRIERFDIIGLEQAQAFLRDVSDTLHNPAEGLALATRGVASMWRLNFEREGAEHQRWRGLSERTREERARAGFSPDHPILQRTGTLLSVAIEQFLEATEGRGAAAGDGIAAEYVISGDTATLHMKGVKVLNQSGKGNLPARPFWYSGGRASEAARTVTEAWLKEKFGG